MDRWWSKEYIIICSLALTLSLRSGSRMKAPNNGSARLSWIIAISFFVIVIAWHLSSANRVHLQPRALRRLKVPYNPGPCYCFPSPTPLLNNANRVRKGRLFFLLPWVWFVEAGETRRKPTMLIILPLLSRASCILISLSDGKKKFMAQGNRKVYIIIVMQYMSCSSTCRGYKLDYFPPV